MEPKHMKKKSPLWALLWLLLIPGQLFLGSAFIALGAYMDVQMFSHPAPDAMGHGAPVFSLIFAMISLVVTGIVLILVVVLTVVRYSAISKRNRAIDQVQMMGQMPYPQQPPEMN